MPFGALGTLFVHVMEAASPLLFMCMQFLGSVACSVDRRCDCCGDKRRIVVMGCLLQGMKRGDTSRH
jgi:hypothetical protein